MIIPIPVGAMRRAAQAARLSEQARRQAAATSGISCPSCGEVDLPLARRRGSRLVHVLLYLAWILPGILYGLWRSQVQTFHCRKCDAFMGEVPLG